jgi:enoyl-CoA hydratase/carnithine racemase
VALTRNIGTKRAMEMLLTGEMIDAATALEFGLVNRIVPHDSLREVVSEYATIIAAKSPVALRLGKEAVYRQSAMELAEAYQHASRVMVENMLAGDAEEGIAAFFGKRRPSWPSE